MPRKGMNGISLLIHEKSPDKTSPLDSLQKFFILEDLYDYLSEQTEAHSHCRFTDGNEQKTSDIFLLIILLWGTCTSI